MIENQIQESMRAAGISPPPVINIDGLLHRFDNGKRGKTGWYVIFPDGIPAGRFGCWRDGVDTTWRAYVDRPLSMMEQMLHARRMSESKKLRDEARELAQSVAAESAHEIWESCEYADSYHKYLLKKSVPALGVKINQDGRLVVPVFGADNEIQSLQFISESGEKRFLKSGKMHCGHYVIGDISRGTVYIAEGFATAATIHVATGSATIVAFSAGNIGAVAGLFKNKIGSTRDIVIVADNDENGVGQAAAISAGEAAGCRVIIPPAIGDVNDYRAAGGDVLALLTTEKKSGWLIPVSEFCAQPAPIKWFVRGWLQQNALIMIHGPSGGGKTFVVLDWVLRVSAGVSEWAGAKVSNGPVVYLAGEGHHGLRGRISAWKEKNGVMPQNMWLSSDGCNLNTPEGYIGVVDGIKSLPVAPKIIIVDTLHRFLHGDENSAQDAKTMIDACGGLMREFGCSVVLVHHTGAGGTDRARGSTAWRGALDIEIGITPGEKGGPIKISQHKSKDSEASKDVYVTLESVVIPGWADEDGGAVSSAAIVPVEAPQTKKTDTAQHMKTFSNAWFASGAETRGNRPYVSKSALKNKLAEDGRSERTIKNDLNPSYNDKLIGFLIVNNYIRAHEHGWIVINETQSSSMMISRLER